MVDRVGPSRQSAKWFYAPFILAGLFGIGFGLANLWQSMRCKGWPHAEGVIVISNIEQHRNAGTHGPVWAPNIYYSYSVGGTNHTGSQVAFGGEESSAEQAQAIISRYPVGSKVAVFYSPVDPEETILEPGIHGGTWIALGVGGLLLGAGLMALYHRVGEARLGT